MKRESFLNKKFILFVTIFMATMVCFAAGTKRVSATKNRNCSQVVIVNQSSSTVRIAEADGVSVTGWIKSGQQSSVNVNNIVLEIGSNCTASSSVSGRNFVITVTGGSSSSYSGSGSGGGNHVDVHCVPCHGSGKCPKCNGDGYYYKSGVNHGKYKCDRCGGNGRCTYCRGTGRK